MNRTSTLYITGLPKDIPEVEIFEYFKNIPGYKSFQLIETHDKEYKLTHINSNTAYVDFIDENMAEKAFGYIDGNSFNMSNEKMNIFFIY